MKGVELPKQMPAVQCMENQKQTKFPLPSTPGERVCIHQLPLCKENEQFQNVNITGITGP